MALEAALFDEKFASNKLPAIYELLKPDSLSIQAEGRLIKLDKRLMGLFILNLMFALFYRVLGEAAGQREGFTAKDLTGRVQVLPDTVLPERRKRQQYISSILSNNEVDRDSPYNRKLFKRIRRGHYIINPQLKLRQGDEWASIHSLLKLEDLDIIAGIVNLQKKLDPRHLKAMTQQIDRFDQYRAEALRSFREYVGAVLAEERRVKEVIEVPGLEDIQSRTKVKEYKEQPKAIKYKGQP